MKTTSTRETNSPTNLNFKFEQLGKEPECVDLEDVREVKKEVLKGGLDQAGIVLLEAGNLDFERNTEILP